MFKKLTDLETKRTILQAIGFYLAYLLLYVLIGAFVGAITAFVYPEKATYNDIFRIGVILSVVLSILISFISIYEKDRFDHFGMLILAILSGILSIFAGGFGGLIPIAIMTTFPSKRLTEIEE